MGRYQKSKPSKKVRAKTEKIREERHQRWQQQQQQAQEETIETLALGVEELVVKLEEKEKELEEVMDHEIELAEEVMILDGKKEGLQVELTREKKWNEVQRDIAAKERHRAYQLDNELRSMRTSISNRDDHINTYRESIRSLREQVGERDRQIRELRRRQDRD